MKEAGALQHLAREYVLKKLSICVNPKPSVVKGAAPMQAPPIETPPARQQPLEEFPPVSAEAAWKPLYRVGAVAALVSVAVVPVAIIVFLAWPPPDFHPSASAVTDWFKLYHDNPLRGILDFDFLMLLGQVFSVPMFLALYAALRRASPSFTAIALVCSLIGTTLYFTVNQAFSMLVLSNQYTAATSDAQRASLVSAGQALLTTYVGTPFDVSYVLGGVATLIIAVVMLRSTIFNKATAYFGIVMGILMLVPSTAGTFGFVLAFLSLVPLPFWDILIAIKLFQLGRGDLKKASPQH
jgi:hypothetical protein